MIFSYNWLKQYLKYKITPKELADILNTYLFEVENIEEKNNDFVFNIDVLPNRADCLSHQGIAREINSILGFHGKAEKVTPIKELKNEFTLKIKSGVSEMEIEQGAKCASFAVLSNIKTGESPKWLKDCLMSLGQKSINNLVDLSNFVILDSGQPLHIFDFDKLKKGGNNDGVKLFIREAKDKEKVKILGGKEYELFKDDLVISDLESPVDIAGIKGGEESSVSESTNHILISSANFDAKRIYNTSKKLNLITDASIIFSHNISAGFSLLGLEELVNLVLQEIGGELEQVFFEEKDKDLLKDREHIIINLNKISSLLGKEINEEIFNRAMYHLNIKTKKEKTGIFKVNPPFYREDLNIPEDIIEEVGRLIGYNNIFPFAPKVSAKRSELNENLEWRSFISRFLLNQGFDEVYNYSLIETPAFYEVSNPLSSKRRFLREDLIHGLIGNALFNQNYFDEFRIFEFGHIFREQNILIEEEKIGALIFSKKGKITDLLLEIRGILDGLFEGMGFDEDDYVVLHKDDILSIKINEQEVGFLGVINKGIYSANNVDLKYDFKNGNIAFFELDIKNLIKYIDYEREFEAPPKFPAVDRDISLFTYQGVKISQILSIIQEIGGNLVEDVELFDVYQNPDSDKKSLAFHIIYRDKNKTLTDKEVNEIHNNIEKELKKRLKVEIR